MNDLVFQDGANYIVGDGVASNSIGKTTALLLVDFAFGGSAYARSEDIELFVGEHIVEVEHIFEGETYRFARSFSQSDKVIRIDVFPQEEISLSSYNNFLKEKYQLAALNLSFRDIVSLYSRIWGKRNTEPARILSVVPNESGTTAVARLIKLYREYGAIELTSQEIKKLNESRKALSEARKHSYLPTYTKRESDKAKKTPVAYRRASWVYRAIYCCFSRVN